MHKLAAYEAFSLRQEEHGPDALLLDLKPEVMWAFGCTIMADLSGGLPDCQTYDDLTAAVRLAKSVYMPGDRLPVEMVPTIFHAAVTLANEMEVVAAIQAAPNN